MSKKSKNRLSKQDKRLIKKAVAKAVANGNSNPQATAKDLKEAFTLVNLG